MNARCVHKQIHIHVYIYKLHAASVNRRAVVTLIGWRRDSRQNWSALHSDARRRTSLSPDNDVRGIDFASSKRDTARRSRSIVTRGRHAYYSHVASHSHHLENFVRHAAGFPRRAGIKEQIVMRPDRHPDARHLPETHGCTARAGIIINNVSPRIPMWPTGFLNISA